MKYFLLVERYVLEALNFTDGSILEVQLETQLDVAVIKSILENLLGYGVIVQEGQKYKIHRDNYMKFVSEKDAYLNKRKEINEIFSFYFWKFLFTRKKV